jgi:hypothetical protein
MLKNVIGLIHHIRDVSVIHAIDKRVFITVPLTNEKGFVIKNTRIECGQLIIEGKLPETKPAS